MFTTENETFAGSRRDYQDADEYALRECIEIIEANVEEVIINKADEREKKWWIDGNYKIIDENRLPLILVEDLPNGDHESAHGEFTEQFLSAFANLPRQDKVKFVGSTTCSATPGRRARGSSKQSDASFVPKLLLNPAQNPRDAQGNPWPTIIVEVASSQSLPSIIQKTTQFWLAPNRVEDVIVLKLWKWNSRRDQNGIPLRRLTCYKFCRRRSLRNARGNYLPVQTIEFGTIDGGNRPYNGCSAPGTCTLNISPRCIYRGCSRQPIANNVVIDLYGIQQEIFDNM
ncbi:hypothetical protein C1646_760775 [Rhizophagus diaphanus]|nr:hypothetical protein C1646_760775 [Rhizophagus diaphanus] [Rhizophagus sp. MUCL 43196]